MRLTISLVALAFAATAVPAESPKDRDVSKWLDERIAAVWPAPEEKRFDQIGWAKDIRSAEELAKKNGRAVFLFTHDGRMGVGRC